MAYEDLGSTKECRVQEAVKIMALDLVRIRKQVKKFILMKANIQAVSLKIVTLRSQNSMAQAMKGVTNALVSMNHQMNLPQIQAILMEFTKQSEMMDMKQEMMEDCIDDAIAEDDDEEERPQHCRMCSGDASQARHFVQFGKCLVLPLKNIFLVWPVFWSLRYSLHYAEEGYSPKHGAVAYKKPWKGTHLGVGYLL
ncbi:CHMP2A [Cordylochernes scorpioides]|uniref:CHMP2A n=1 Tax=Cordylochernes scorpioides TaxID=51811 RepID=A0ABY6KB71_9ARAC|nr:CHMP2A [Cordylochernes scorpioides]